MDIGQIVDRILDGDSFSVYTTIKIDEKFERTLSAIGLSKNVLEPLLSLHLFEISVDINKIENEVHAYTTLFTSNDKLYEFICSYSDLRDDPESFVDMLIKAESIGYESLNNAFNDYATTKSPLQALMSGKNTDIFDSVEEHISIKTEVKMDDIEQSEDIYPKPYDNKNFLLHNANPNDKQTCSNIDQICKYVYNTIISILRSGNLYGIKVQYITKNPVDEDLIVVSLFESDIAFGGILMGGSCSCFENNQSIIMPSMEYISENNYEKTIHDMVGNNIFETLTVLNKISSGDININIVSVINNKEECKYVC